MAGGEIVSEQQYQAEFNATIGRLDHILSVLIRLSKDEDGDLGPDNQQTLKHHAEDMIGAGNKILENLALA
jgi:hypothetical protein